MRARIATALTLALVLTSSTAAAGQEASGQSGTGGLLAGLVTEEVEPGVLRVLGGGVRELAGSIGRSGLNDELAIGLDGSVWLMGDRDLLELGAEQELPYPDGRTRENVPWPVQVGSDGTPWIVAHDGTVEGRPVRWTLYSHDGTAWRPRLKRTGNVYEGLDFRLQPDGTVWALRETDRPGGGRFLRLEGDSWTRLPKHPADKPKANNIRSWDVAPDGALWLRRKTAVSRLTDDGWMPVAGLPGYGFVIGSDGAVRTLALGGESIVIRSLKENGDKQRLEVPLPVGGTTSAWWNPGVLGPDGSLWASFKTEQPCGVMCSHLVSCDGLGRFDGTTWRRFLTDRCVQEIDIDVDGNVWVRAASTSDGDVVTLEDGTELQTLGLARDSIETYVITPDAASAIE